MIYLVQIADAAPEILTDSQGGRKETGLVAKHEPALCLQRLACLRHDTMRCAAQPCAWPTAAIVATTQRRGEEIDERSGNLHGKRAPTACARYLPACRRAAGRGAGFDVLEREHLCEDQ